MTHLYEAVLWLLLGALWWHFHWPHRQYWVDETRYRLFVIRDNLFNAAARGSVIRFDDEAYGTTRTTINGMLRTLEDLSFWRIVLFSWRYNRDSALRKKCQRYREETAHAVNKLSPEGRALIEEMMRQAGAALLDHIISISLLFWIVFKGFSPLWWILKRAIEFKPSLPEKYSHALDFESNIAGHNVLGRT